MNNNNNNKLAIELIGNYLKQIDQMNPEGRIKYSKVYEALKNTSDLLESLDNLNMEEANVYINTFITVISESLIKK